MSDWSSSTSDDSSNGSDSSDDESDWSNGCLPFDDYDELRDSLEHLRLMGYPMSSLVDYCCEILRQRKELIYVDTEGGEDVEILAEALKVNTTITYLVLGIFEPCFLPVMSLNKTIKKLDPSFHGGMSNEDFSALANALKTNEAINNLNFSGNEIGKEGGMAIAELLETNTTLTKLDLSFDSLGNDGCIAIASALEANKTLTKLNLSRNCIGKEGGVALAECLKINNTLIELTSEHNPIGNDGCMAIASALQANTSLSCLNLVDNELGNEVAFEFASALALNKRLKQLNLSGNRIDTEGCEALIGVLQTKNTTLAKLDVSSVRCEEDKKKQMAYFWNKIHYCLKLNMAGREIMSSGSATTKEQVEALIQNRRKIGITFGFLLLKPDLCEEGVQHYSIPEGEKDPKQNKNHTHIE